MTKNFCNLIFFVHHVCILQDVSLYMNPCPYTVFHHAPLPRVFNIFRTMGLRHLPVMEDSGIVSIETGRVDSIVKGLFGIGSRNDHSP